ncbi:hypothetical protein ACFLYB_05745 [Chloroflexota bacterium]
MNKVICPYCENNLTDDNDLRERQKKDNYNIADNHFAGTGKMMPDGIFQYAFVTCPKCNKILGVINSSPIPITYEGHSYIGEDKFKNIK